MWRWALLLAMLATGVAAAAEREVAAAGPVRLSADSQFNDGRLWRGEGSVQVMYQDVEIRCQRLEYDRQTMDVVADGEVVVDQGPARFTADELHYNLRTKAGLFVNGSGEIPPYYSFTGKLIEKLDATHYRIDDATFTACEAAARPPWHFRIRSALIEEEGYGRFRNPTLNVKGVPVFWVPYMLWPVKRERSPGLLMPSIGYSNRHGFSLGNGLYLPLGRSYDTTLYLDYYSRGFYGIGSEWRWAPVADADGEITLRTIFDRDRREWEWKIDGRHAQDDLLGFRLLAEVEDVSDNDFFQEFERNFDQSTRSSVLSYLYLTRSWGSAALNIRADRRTTYREPEDWQLNQFPEVELRVRPTRIGHSSLYWSLISSANLFDVDKGGDLEAAYARADLFPELSYTLPGPLWLTVTPRLSGRLTHWTRQLAEDRKSYVDEGLDRQYMSAGIDVVGPSVSRVFDRPLGPYSRFKHLIEPRVEYTFVSGFSDQTRVPYFDELDNVPVLNRVKLILANRLFARSRRSVSATEIASLELFQEYSFDEPLTRGGGDLSSRYGPLGAALRLTPVSGTSLDARAAWDTLFDTLQSTSLSASYSGNGPSAGLTWYQSYTPSTGLRASSQIRTTLGWRKSGFPLQASVQYSYDIERRETQQQQLRLHYEGSCWGISAEYRDLRVGVYPTRDFQIVISLKGVGSLPEIKGSLGGLN